MLTPSLKKICQKILMLEFENADPQRDRQTDRHMEYEQCYIITCHSHVRGKKCNLFPSFTGNLDMSHEDFICVGIYYHF